MTHLWNIILTYALLSLRYVHSLECPFSCRCYQQSGINSIFCVNTNRHYVPNYFDFEVKLVNISGNAIPRLTDDSFQNQHYRSLEILDLRRNGISRIDNKAFYTLKNLLEIDLSRNQLRYVNRKMFSDNRFLNTIVLSGNPITTIKPYAFPFSIYLRHLDFQGCRIKHIDDRAFVNSPMVEYINLKDNKLRSLSLNVLHNSSQLTRLLLDGNPWRCDRRLWSLLKWIRDHEVGKDSLLCVYGETDDAILWDTMDVENVEKFKSYPAWTRPSRRSRRSRSEVLLGGYQVDANENENEDDYSNLQDDILNKVELPRTSATKGFKTDDKVRLRPAEPAALDSSTERIIVTVPKVKGKACTEFFSKLSRENEKSSDHRDRGTGIDIDQSTIPNDAYAERRSEADAAYENDDMNLLLGMIAIEFVLLLVLLYILYKLWKWNKEGYDSGASTPINSCSKNGKTYDTNSPGYKRYSLSDDNFSLNQNHKEEGKFDAESGYLSYRRHNSVEGETNSNNEFSFYRRYPPESSLPNSQNLNSRENSSDSSVIGPRSHDSATSESKSSGIRRNSSTRSLGRKVKMNPYNRSISVDTSGVSERYNLD